MNVNGLVQKVAAAAAITLARGGNGDDYGHEGFGWGLGMRPVTSPIDTPSATARRCMCHRRGWPSQGVRKARYRLPVMISGPGRCFENFFKQSQRKWTGVNGWSFAIPFPARGKTIQNNDASRDYRFWQASGCCKRRHHSMPCGGGRWPPCRCRCCIGSTRGIAKGSGHRAADRHRALHGLPGICICQLARETRMAEELPREWESRDVTLNGLIANLPQRTDRGVRFEFEVESIATPGAVIPSQLSLSWYDEVDRKRGETKAAPNVIAGERWTLTVRV